MKKNKLFILTIGLAFIGWSLLYIAIFCLSVNEDIKISHSYKQFLLEHAPSPRLIIDSGSNSFHALNSAMLEQELGLPVVNLADNVSYPLKHKLLRIEKYSFPGDIVLLPLEWHYYSYSYEDYMPSIFLENMFGQLNYYYKGLSWIEKLGLMIETPFSKFVIALFEGKFFSKITFFAKLNIEYNRLLDHEERFKNKERGGARSIDTPPVTGEIEGSCKKYVLTKQLKNGFFISNTFKDNIKIIKHLQKKGIKVFFTWPSVAGNNCYNETEADKFNSFVEQIKKYLTKNEMIFVSEPEESNFQYNYILNTFYHITPEARDIRTKSLIKDIKSSSVSKWFHKEFKPQILNINAVSFKKEILGLLDTISEGQRIRFGAENMDSNVFLEKGWFFHDPTRVWSKGNKSTVLIKLGNDLINKDLKVVMESVYYKKGDESKTDIVINKKDIGTFILNGKTEFIIPKDLAKKENGLLEIEFYYKNVKSPFDYGDSMDTRKFKLVLNFIMFLPKENK